MKHIQLFEGFINHFYSQLNEKKIPADAIAIVMAATDTTPIKPDLAKKMGVLVDQKYTFEVENLLNFLFKISKDKKFPADVIGKPTKVTAKKDILEIGENKIDQKGSIFIAKKDVKQPLKITASNNGFLCLLRMGKAVSELYKDGDISLFSGIEYSDDIGNMREASDWLIKFSLGAYVDKKGVSEERGYDYYYVSPGTLGPTANRMMLSLSMGLLQFGPDSKAKMGIARNNPDLKSLGFRYDETIDKQYNDVIKDCKSIEEVVQKIALEVAKSLKDRDMISNPDPKPNTQGATEMIKNWNKYLRRTDNPSKLGPQETSRSAGIYEYDVSNDGVAPFQKVMKDIAEAVAPTEEQLQKFNLGNSEITRSYRDGIIKGLSNYGAAAMRNWMLISQKISSWSSAKMDVGLTGEENKRQASGKY